MNRLFAFFLSRTLGDQVILVQCLTVAQVSNLDTVY